MPSRLRQLSHPTTLAIPGSMSLKEHVMHSGPRGGSGATCPHFVCERSLNSQSNARTSRRN